MENLTGLEIQVLKMYIKAETDRVYAEADFKIELEEIDPEDEALIALIKKAYINGKIKTGKMGAELAVLDRGCLLSDKTINSLNLKL